MADRQDIDALLIDALYGELDGDERGRLEAHLVTHPRDRADLEDMRATRAMLRDANVASSLGLAEPPSAISAKLLQEAARRAPVPRAADQGFLAWFTSMFRPMLMHPGLSAAAALVVVGGAAGVMYANGRFRTAQPAAPEHVSAPTLRPSGDSGSAATTPDLPTLGTATGTGSSYPVALDDTLAKDLANADGAELLRRQEQLGTEGVASFATESAATGTNRGAFAAQDEREAPAKKLARPTGGLAATQLETPADAPKRKAAAKADGYLELDKNMNNDLQVRDVDDDQVDGEVVARSRVGAGAGAAPPPPPTAPRPSAPATVAQKPSAPSAADPGRAATYDAKAEAQLTVWARDQHARMAKLVVAGKCNDAGIVGADISRRAPEYYQSNVANDRTVRACRSYVERARRAKQQEATKSRAAQPRNNDARPDEAAPTSIK